jgi:hypothetical protein
LTLAFVLELVLRVVWVLGLVQEFGLVRVPLLGEVLELVLVLASELELEPGLELRVVLELTLEQTPEVEVLSIFLVLQPLTLYLSVPPS